LVWAMLTPCRSHPRGRGSGPWGRIRTRKNRAIPKPEPHQPVLIFRDPDPALRSGSLLAREVVIRCQYELYNMPSKNKNASTSFFLFQHPVQ
jgi:hypothetical protein